MRAMGFVLVRQYEPCVYEPDAVQNYLRGLETHLVSGLGFGGGFKEQLPEVI